MAKVLISYRREDSSAYAGRLADRLSAHFGHDNVFIDVDSIKPGDDFVRSIAATVIACDAVVAVIGKRWLTEQDASGSRRLDRPDDFLRIELATAFDHGVPVFPVLVGGALMPEARDLPGDLSKLGRLQALRIDDTEFHEDVRRLIEALEPTGQTRSPVKPAWSVAQTLLGKGARRWSTLGAIGLLVVIALVWSRRAPSEFGSDASSERLRGQTATSSSGDAKATIATAAADAPELVSGAAPPVRTLTDAGTIGRPVGVDPAITYQLTLDPDETAYLAVSKAVRDLLIVIDMRSGDGARTNLQSDVSFLDADGATILPHAVTFNEIDFGWRHLQTFTFGRRPVRVALKLVNGDRRNVFWLTLFDAARAPFLPFFGQMSPRVLHPGQAETGEVEPGEDVYFRAALKKGNYRIVADFTNVPRDKTNIQGYLARLDRFGANQQSLIGFNEIDFAFRETATLTVTQDGPEIFRLQNGRVTRTSYSLRVTPDPGPAP